MLYSGHKINVISPSGAGNRHFLDLLARISDHINIILKYFHRKMPYTTVRAVSSLPVAGAKMALSVHTWLTKHKEATNYIIFMPVSVIFHCCVHICISGEK